MNVRQYRHHCQVTRLLSLQQALAISVVCLAAGLVAGSYLQLIAGTMSAITKQLVP